MNMNHVYAVYITRKSMLLLNSHRYSRWPKSFCIEVKSSKLEADIFIKELKILLPEAKFYKLKLECLKWKL